MYRSPRPWLPIILALAHGDSGAVAGLAAGYTSRSSASMAVTHIRRTVREALMIPPT